MKKDGRLRRGDYKSQAGISLITVIITIIVIIILAAISFTMLNTQDQAVLAKYRQEFEELRKSVETRRIADAKTGLEDADKAFSLVKVSGDIPYNFIFIDNGGEKCARLVSLDIIGCDEMSTGHEYKKFEAFAAGSEIKTVEFGKDDVYVYDATGRLYFAKGFEYNGKVSYDVTNNEAIRNIEKHIDGDDVVIVIYTEYEGGINNVTVDGEEARKTGDGVYEYTVDENGTYEVIIEDSDGNQYKEEVVVTEIGSGATSIDISAEVTNSYAYEDGVYKVKGKNAEIKIDSPNAKYMYVSNNDSYPDTWFPFAEDIERNYTSGGSKTIYIWTKDEHGNVSEMYTLNIEIEIDTPERPVIPDVDTTGDIIFTLTPDNDTWAKEKTLTIQYTDGRQSDGYQSLYRIKGTTGWGKWTISYENELNTNITRNNTEVEARIIYKTTTKEVEIAATSGEVERIDTISPKITSLTIDGNIIKGTAEDNESGLASTPYLITTQEINFKYITDIDSYDWSDSNTLEVSDKAKYNFYVRDYVGNVSVASISVDASDKIAPVIESLTTESIADYAKIEIVATDNIGVTGYAIVKGDSSVPPTEWIKADGSKKVEIENNTIKEDGTYTIWVKDDAGNTTSKKITIKLNELPVMNGEYPRNVYTKENTEVTFEVKFEKQGSPDEYSYKWQVSKDGGSTWNYIDGATSGELTFTAQYSDNNNLYRCEIIHERGNVMSGAGKLEVVKITKNKPDAEVLVNKEMIAGGVIINGGANETTENELTLEIIAINAEQMNISETTTKGTWEKYKENKSYTLKDITKGTKNIYVWFKDGEGNVTEYVTNSIELR